MERYRIAMEEVAGLRIEPAADDDETETYLGWGSPAVCELDPALVAAYEDAEAALDAAHTAIVEAITRKSPEPRQEGATGDS